jgi:hypothetical protein
MNIRRSHRPGFLGLSVAGVLAACAAAKADLQLLGVQYRADQAFPEHECFWHSSDLPAPCGASDPMGASAHVFLRNTGPSAVTVQDVLLAGYSLATCLETQYENDGRQPASIYYYYTDDNDPGGTHRANLENAGEPVWYEADPITIEPGTATQVMVRLRRTPVTAPVSIEVVTDAGSVLTTVPVDADQPRLASVDFAPDLDTIYLYWRRASLGDAPATILMDGTDVTSSATTTSDPALDTAVSVLGLGSPLADGSYHVFQGVYGDGKSAAAGLRASADEFAYGIWGGWPGSLGEYDKARAYIADVTDHMINAQIYSLTPPVRSFLKDDPDGWSFAAERGLDMFVVDEIGKWGVTNPYGWFIKDEPDAKDALVGHDVPALTLPFGRQVGSLARMCVERADYLRTGDPTAPTILNVDNTFKPYNWYNYGQLPDLLASDPYYQPRLRQALASGDPDLISLYSKATSVYAASQLAQSGAEPIPLHVILFACKDLSTGFPFPTPESKRTEVYYALAGGAKGLSYWWYTPANPWYGVGAGTIDADPEAEALWREIGLLGAEVRTAGPVLLKSCPAALSITPSSGLWARSLISGSDTVVLLAVHDDYYNDETGCHYTPLDCASLAVDLPTWMTSPTAFEITAFGTRDVDTQLSGNQLTVSLGTVDLTRMIIVTSDPDLRTTLQDRYDTQFRTRVCKLEPAKCRMIDFRETWDTYAVGTSDPAYEARWDTLSELGTVRYQIRDDRAACSLPNALLVQKEEALGITHDLADELAAALAGGSEVLGNDTSPLDLLYYAYMHIDSADSADIFVELSKGNEHAPDTDSPDVVPVLAFGVTAGLLESPSLHPRFFDGQTWHTVALTAGADWNTFSMQIRTNDVQLAGRQNASGADTLARAYLGGFDRISIRTGYNTVRWRTLDDVYLSGGKVVRSPCTATDPCEAQLAKLVAPVPEVAGYFGYSVAISSDVAVIGAPQHDDVGTDSGSAYVFRYDPAPPGSWDAGTKLDPGADVAAGDHFGHSVAISDGVAVIGADMDDDKGSSSGSAYVFRYNGASWVKEAKLHAFDGAAYDYFGVSVAISGDVAVIGAFAHDDNGSGSGSAYVFRYDPGPPGSWDAGTKLDPGADGAAGDYFGDAVAISGDAIVIGADGKDDNGSHSGAAYVFRYDGLGWAQEAKLLPADGAADDHFGSSAAISGNAVVIGASRHDDNGSDSGSVYVFRYDPGPPASWDAGTKLDPGADGAAGDMFGHSVAISDAVAVIGALGDDDNGNSSGSAYVFRFDGSSWDQEDKLIAGDGAAEEAFGEAVAISGDLAVIGTPFRDEGPTSCGAAYVFDEVDCAAGCEDCDCSGTGDACEPDVIIDCDTDLDQVGVGGDPVPIVPGGGSGVPTEDAMVSITNETGGDNATIVVEETDEILHPEATGYRALGKTLTVDTSLLDGEFSMTVSVPFNPDEVAADPCGDDGPELLWFNPSTGNWDAPAVVGNTQPDRTDGTTCEDNDDPIIGCFVCGAPTGDLGDYGVYWDGAEGYVWAIVDHASDFAAMLRSVASDYDVDGDVDLSDYGAFLTCYNGPGNPPAAPDCAAADFDDDGDVDLSDYGEFLSCYNGPGNPPAC